MAKKNFKDMYKDVENAEKSKLDEKLKGNVLSDEKGSIVSPMPSVGPVHNNFSRTYEKEAYKEELKEKFTDELTEEIKKELRTELHETVKAELTEELMQSLRKDLEDRVLSEAVKLLSESNAPVINAIRSLEEKISKLSENLNIKIPTPVVNVAMPKTKKIVTYDEQGRISGVEDVED